MFCPNCGKEAAAGDSFCANCGHALGGGVEKNASASTPEKVQEELPKRFCPYCGQEVNVGDEWCGNCFGALNAPSHTPTAQAPPRPKSDYIAVRVFMIIGCIAGAFFYLVPLVWNIPLTVHVFKRLNKGAPISTGIKICVLLFCNLIAGILLLCDYPSKTNQ